MTRQAGLLIALITVGTTAAGCSSSGSPRVGGPNSQYATQAHDTAAPPSQHSGPPSGGPSFGSTGQFTKAFAACMRAHGVARFPDPDGSGAQLGPDSGVDLMAPEFQAAVNGPCKALAPQSWVAGGPGTLPALPSEGK